MKDVALLLVVAALGAGTLAGCETTRGLGYDLQNTGANLADSLKNVDPNDRIYDLTKEDRQDKIQQDNATESEDQSQTE